MFRYLFRKGKTWYTENSNSEFTGYFTMEYKRFGGKLLVRIDKDEEIGETNLILGGQR